jgi:hypothetical protein
LRIPWTTNQWPTNENKLAPLKFILSRRRFHRSALASRKQTFALYISGDPNEFCRGVGAGNSAQRPPNAVIVVWAAK